MPRKSEKDRVKDWRRRIDSANRAWKTWHDDKYHCDKLWDHYCGKQWDPDVEEKYVINLFFANTELRKPSLLYYRPRVKIEPKAPHADDQGSRVEERAKLTQDTVNTFIADRKVGFDDATRMALFESFFRFGVVEVGYTADIIDNPNAGKPILNDNNEEMVDEDGEKVLQPAKLPQNERIFVKRIPARQFRFSVNGKFRINENDWVGYYEWHYPSDIKNNPRYSNTANLKVGGKAINESPPPEDEPNTDEDYRARGLVKIWKLWSIREKTRLVVPEEGDRFLLEESYKRLPFSLLRFHPQLDDPYPVPPTFNWLHPQHQYNEIREMQKIHRKRFYRRYGITPDVEKEELRKIEDGGDGVYGVFPRPESIWPIPDAPLDAAMRYAVPETKEDFREVSGITGEERGIVQSETATQAQILDVNSRLRESYSRVQVGEWLAEIADLMLFFIREYMPVQIWVKINVDELAPSMPQETINTVGLWKEIKKKDLLEEFDISVDIEQLSPMSREMKRQNWNQVLTLITNPVIVMMLSASEVLLRQTLKLYDITSEKEIVEIKKAMQAVLMMLQAQAQAQQQKSGLGMTGAAQPGPTPTQGQIGTQLMNQLPQ